MTSQKAATLISSIMLTTTALVDASISKKTLPKTVPTAGLHIGPISVRG